MKFILRWLVTAIAAAVAIWIVPGVGIQGGSSWGAIAAFALVLSLVDISIKPIMQVLSLPISILSLGIFYIVVNTLMLYLAKWLANGLFGAGVWISGFGWAFLASIIISIVSTLMNSLISDASN